jgi:hypothetical protein
MGRVNEISYKIIKKESIFEGKILKEKVDVKLLEKILRNPQLLIVNEDFDETIQLKNFLKLIKNGFVKVTYNRSNYNIGRSYSFKSLSYQNISKRVRHTLCWKYYIDIDIVNCHPVLLYQVCIINNRNTPNLKKYIENRELLLKMVMNTYNTDRSKAKNLFIRLLYLGKIETWERDNDLEHKEQPFLLSFYEEMKGISELITIYNKDILDEINKKKGYKKKSNNFGCYFKQKLIKREDKESFMCYYLQELENRVLEVMFNYLKNNGYIEDGITTLCYDGIMIMIIENYDNLLLELNEVVLKETGFDLTFEVKEMNEGFKESEYKEEVDFEDDNEVERLLIESFEKFSYENNLNEEERVDFDIDFFENILGNLEYPLNYIQMKKYFEKHFIYILKENSYYQVRKEFRYDRNKNKQINLILEEYNERGLCKIMLETSKGRESFIMLLNKDNFKKYKTIIFNPVKMENRNYFNIFKGFGYTEISNKPNEKHLKIFKEWLNYILKYVCEDNEGQYKYFMNYLANIIQEPDFKPHICYILYSNDKGTGKSSLCKMLRKLVGMKHSFIGNVRVIFEKHSTSSEYKFLNVLEELDKKMGHETYEQLKDKIQNDYCNVNKKYKDIIELKDYTRYMITTNDYKSLRIDRNHRRFALLNFKLTEDEGILEMLNEVYEVNSNIYVKLLGEYLENWKIEYNTRREWIDNRCSSNKLKLFLKTSQTQELLVNFYMSDLDYLTGSLVSNNTNVYNISCRSLYDTYVENSSNKKFLLGKMNFKKDLKTFDFISIKKSGVEMYRINMTKLYDYLMSESLIEEGVFVNKYIEEE